MARYLAVWAIVVGLAGCGKAEDKADEPGDLFVKLAGTVQVPLSASRVKLFNAGKAGYDLAASWQSCVKLGATDHSAVLPEGAVLVESTATCTGVSYVTIATKDSLDLSGYANGSLRFTVEISAIGQSLELLLQDATTKTSVAVDLTGYGYNPSTLAVPQAIVIPASAIATNGVDFAHLRRPFQVNLRCTGSGCQAKFDAIEWAAAPGTTGYSGMRSASLGLIHAGAGGWPGAGAIIAVSTKTGTYSVTTAFPGTSPAFLIAADPDTGFTYMARIPPDTLNDEGVTDLALNVDLASTLAAMAEFPGGNADGPEFFEHPNPTEFAASFAAQIRAFLELYPPELADPLPLLEPVLAEPAVIGALNAGRTTAEKGPATVSAIISANQATPPKFNVPVN